MEVMEDGNLMDKVLILIKRDFEYYKANQSVLQETICPGVAGGRLDFPRYASFAAVKLVLWWEDEFFAGFRTNSGLICVSAKPVEEDLTVVGGVKSSNPEKFITLIAKSSAQLLEHLHVLTQEALDHADLGVLMGTLGAAVLLKNCLWFYIQQCCDGPKEQNLTLDPIQKCYKEYQEMGEALAERLLDVYCRLLSLYILQDAESLDWENSKPFFESERGSYVIQMWWLYMQGTKQELWRTIPPKMAQSVLAGMLNETLTILTVRYTQARASEGRTKLLIVDISNLLLCVGQLLPCICNSTEEVIGLSLNTQSKVIRDIHAKCQELFICLVMRATPLDTLHKAFRKGTDTMELLKSRTVGPCPWTILGLPHIFPKYPNIIKLSDLGDNAAIALEIFLLLAQPQPNWALVLKTLCMRNGRVITLLLNAFKDGVNAKNHKNDILSCNGFLCMGTDSCKKIDTGLPFCTPSHSYNMVASLTYILLHTGNSSDVSNILLSFIDGLPNWFHHFDRRQIWNINHASWYSAILTLLQPYLEPIASTVISAVQSGASMYQAMTIVLACFIQLWDCIDMAIPRIGLIFQDILPVDITPMGKSTLLQILISALYETLLNKVNTNKREVTFAHDNVQEKDPTLEHRQSMCGFDSSNGSEQAVALAIAESLCSIDEDDKHTEEIDELLELANRSVDSNTLPNDGCKRVEQSKQMAEVLASNLLVTPEGKKSLMMVNDFILCNSEWLLQILGVSGARQQCEPNRAVPHAETLLETMFYVGYRPFDQVLTGEWQPDWISFLQIPMGLSVDRIWNQMSLRWEFADDKIIPIREAKIVADLTAIFKPT